jgi:hypothetical protein
LKSPCENNLWSKYDNFKKEILSKHGNFGPYFPKNKNPKVLAWRGLDIVPKIGESQGI